MYTRIKNDFEEGIGKIKWFAGLLSQRVRAEIAIFRLLWRAEELSKKRDALLRKIGEEVYQLHKDEKAVHPNKEMIDAIKEIEAIDMQIKENTEKASDIGRTTS